MNASAKQRQMRRNVLNNMRYSVGDLDYIRKPKEVDTLIKAQNLKAASILLVKLYEQEVTRNAPDVITGYYASKTGRYVDTAITGRTPIDTTPPSDWPFSESEWFQATQNGPYFLLGKINAYLLHEEERQYRKNEAHANFGVGATDPEQLERLRNTREKQRKINQRNWRKRMKDSIGFDSPDWNGVTTSAPTSDAAVQIGMG